MVHRFSSMVRLLTVVGSRTDVAVTFTNTISVSLSIILCFKDPKQKQIKSKPTQQENAIKSKISYPNLKKIYRCWWAINFSFYVLVVPVVWFFLFLCFFLCVSHKPHCLSLFLSWCRTNFVSLCDYIFLKPFICIFTTLFSSSFSVRQASLFF